MTTPPRRSKASRADRGSLPVQRSQDYSYSSGVQVVCAALATLLGSFALLCGLFSLVCIITIIQDWKRSALLPWDVLGVCGPLTLLFALLFWLVVSHGKPRLARWLERRTSAKVHRRAERRRELAEAVPVASASSARSLSVGRTQPTQEDAPVVRVGRAAREKP